jgi:prealbumin domain-containing protein
MSIRASRGTRLLLAAAIAWFGLALCAQAAHATYGKVQVAKINNGGNPADTFTFHPSLTPTASDFTLKGGDSSSLYSIECNIDRPGYGSECSKWGYPTLKFSEQQKSGYTLTDITCRFTQGTSGFASAVTTTSAVKPSSEVTKDLANGSVSLKVHWYEQVKCWFTNTKNTPPPPPTGTLKVTKKLVPATDGGKFNLLIDGVAKATNVGDGGTTGTQTVNTGAHTVGESAGTSTSLSNYDSTLSCVDKAHGGAPDNDGSVQVDAGDAWECVITNTRKATPPPPTGTLKVTKKLVPAADGGKFNLLIDGAAKAANVGDGGTTGTQTVAIGQHTVGESAGTGTSLSNYDSSLTCVDKVHGGPADNDGSVQVDAGDAWDCVITNTRKSTPTPPTQPPTNTPPAQIKVSPARVVPGSAKMRGPRGCPINNVVAATITGKRIVKVTFYIDGHKVKTLTKPNGKGGAFKLPVNVRKMSYGAHRVMAKIQFAKSSGTKAKTLRLSFSHCSGAAAQPQFTG